MHMGVTGLLCDVESDGSRLARQSEYLLDAVGRLLPLLSAQALSRRVSDINMEKRCAAFGRSRDHIDTSKRFHNVPRCEPSEFREHDAFAVFCRDQVTAKDGSARVCISFGDHERDSRPTINRIDDNAIRTSP